MSFFELQWWVYVCLVASFFGICMGLNYLVKKFNEARIDERLIRMLQKASTTQSTQVNGPLIAVETGGAARLNSLKIEQSSPPGISLVFNREENKRRSDPYNLIKPRLSLETVNPISPSARTVKSVPLKRIGSAHVAAKINSSLIATEKVVVKNNKFGHQTAKETSSTAKSDCYVTQLITVQENKVLTQKDSNKSKSVCDGRVNPSESSTFIHVQDDTAIKSIAQVEFDSIKIEGTTPVEQNDSVTEKVPCKTIHDGHIVSSKTSIVEITANKSAALCDTKSNEEINTGGFIKRSVESIVSKITSHLKNKNEDQKIVQNATDILIAAQQSLNHSESRRNVTEIFSVEKKDSRCSATKQTSSPSKIVNAGENFPVENIVSEDAKKIVPDPKNEFVGEIFPVTKVESLKHIAAKETTSSHSHNDRKGESFPVKITDSQHIAVKKSTSSHSHGDRTGEIFPVKNIVSEQTKETFSDSKSDYVGEIIPIINYESLKHTAAKESTSSHSDSNHTGETFPVKTTESEHIAAKETLLYAGIDPPVNELLLSVKKSVTMIESRRVNSENTFCPSTKSTTRTNYKAIEYFPIKKKASGLIVPKETVSDTRSYPIVTQVGLNEEKARGPVATITPFYIRSGITIHKPGPTSKRESGSSAVKETPKTNTSINSQIDGNVPKSTTVKMSEAARNAVKAKYLKELMLEKNKDDVDSDNSAKKMEDSTVMPDTSKSSDDTEGEPSKSLTDKIKELLEDEDTVDTKLHKPSSSAKK